MTKEIKIKITEAHIDEAIKIARTGGRDGRASNKRREVPMSIFEGDLIANPGVIYPYMQVTGSIYASGADTKTAFPKLTSVGGSIYARGVDTKTAFPKLTSVGGYIDASGADTKTAFPCAKINDAGAAARCRAMLLSAFSAAGFSFADGVLARIVFRRGWSSGRRPIL